MFATLGPFLAISLVVIMSPGPDTALVLRNSLWGNRRSGAATAFGVATGLAIWTASASLGLAALIRASEPAFLVLKLVGAAYLIYLGSQALLSAIRPRSATDPALPLVPAPRNRGASYRQGLLSNLANPKIAVFFTTFLPQFVPANTAELPALLVLGLIFCLITATWLVLYAVVAARVAQVLRRPRVHKAIEGTTGLVLVGFGLRLAIDRR